LKEEENYTEQEKGPRREESDADEAGEGRTGAAIKLEHRSHDAVMLGIYNRRS